MSESDRQAWEGSGAREAPTAEAIVDAVLNVLADDEEVGVEEQTRLRMVERVARLVLGGER